MAKVLQINITANWGSTGKISEQIGLAAMNRGWVSYIAYGRWSNPSKSHLIKVGSKLDTYYHYGVQRIFDNEGLCSTGATKKLIEQIQLIRPDVIHLHNIHDHYINYKVLFGYLNKSDIKVVWTFHDCWAFTGHCMHFVTVNCNRWKTGCHDCLMRGKYPKTIFDRSSHNWKTKREIFTSNKNLTIIACSDWLADYVRESFFCNNNVITIHNGVDIKTFRSSADKSGNFNVIAVSSVWHRDKGLYDIYKLRTMLSDDIGITIVGLQPSQLKDLPKGIHGITRTQNVQELVDLYSNANVLINPTYADNFPTVNLEALACGTPVITYKTGGSPEAIDSKTGIVVNQGDVVALANAILYTRANPFDGKECRKRAELYFDKDKCFEEYINLYETLLSNEN